MTTTDGRSRLRGVAILAAALATLLPAACGGGEPEEGGRTQPAGEAPAGEAGGDGERRAASGGGDAARGDRGARKPRDGAASDRAGGPGECAFEAPPGRLAEDRVVVELSGVPCKQGVALARAAALGQPAGANLVIERDGFRCEPSTAEKGANVTYACTGPRGEVGFEVLWTAGGG